MVFLWASRFFAYFGLQFNIGELGNTFVLNFTTMGLAEMGASLLSAPVKRRISRKKSMQISLCICCFACMASLMGSFPILIALCRILANFSCQVFNYSFLQHSHHLYRRSVPHKIKDPSLRFSDDHWQTGSFDDAHYFRLLVPINSLQISGPHRHHSAVHFHLCPFLERNLGS